MPGEAPQPSRIAAASSSSTYPLIPLIGGLFIFRERLRPQLVGGAALIVACLVLLGLGS